MTHKVVRFANNLDAQLRCCNVHKSTGIKTNAVI